VNCAEWLSRAGYATVEPGEHQGAELWEYRWRDQDRLIVTFAIPEGDLFPFAIIADSLKLSELLWPQVV